MSKILMVASEAAPFAKTGGLADVLGSLPSALSSLGEQVAVLLPLYRGVQIPQSRRIYDHLPIWLGTTHYDASVHRISGPVPYFFLDCPQLYDRDGLYGTPGGDFPDNHIRFAALSRAALEVARRIFRPQVIHCHDWQSGLVPMYLKTALAGDPTFLGIRTLLTIHNLGYQGLFPPAAMDAIGLDPSLYHPGGVEFFGKLNFLKAGILYSDAINTVSPTYKQEIQTPAYGFGLDGLLRDRRDSLSGILNGVDYSQWDPRADLFIAAKYSAADLAGKKACKRELLREFGFDVNQAAKRPLIGVVTRLASQKGVDLIAGIADQLAREDAWLIVQGKGDDAFEKIFRDLAKSHPDKIGVRIVQDEGLAHRIEAGSDMFLMPSRYEPCGLNQMYSLRYGTIPVVRATGGLDDTITKNTGFKFSEASGAALLGSIHSVNRVP